MFFPNVLAEGVPKVSKGCQIGFCHFWHFVTLGFRDTHDHKRNKGETALEKSTSRKDAPANAVRNQDTANLGAAEQIGPDTDSTSAEETCESLTQQGAKSAKIYQKAFGTLLGRQRTARLGVSVGSCLGEGSASLMPKEYVPRLLSSRVVLLGSSASLSTPHDIVPSGAA